MTPANVIDYVKRMLQDSALLRTPNTYSDATLLLFVNTTLKRMVMLRPDLFSIIATVPTVPNTVFQNMPSDSFRLVDIFQVANANTLEEVDRDQFDRTNINWASEPAGTPVKFMRHPRNPSRFFLYPRPTAGIQLVAEYVKTQPTYGLSDTITGLSDDYLPAVADGTIFSVLTIDNDANATQDGIARAKIFYDSFAQALGVSAQVRAITDFEDGGVRTAQGAPRDTQ